MGGEIPARLSQEHGIHHDENKQQLNKELDKFTKKKKLTFGVR